MVKVSEMTNDELFGEAMSGIKRMGGQNPNARRSELAVEEMHRRLRMLEKIGWPFFQTVDPSTSDVIRELAS